MKKKTIIDAVRLAIKPASVATGKRWLAGSQLDCVGFATEQEGFDLRIPLASEALAVKLANALSHKKSVECSWVRPGDQDCLSSSVSVVVGVKPIGKRRVEEASLAEVFGENPNKAVRLKDQGPEAAPVEAVKAVEGGLIIYGLLVRAVHQCGSFITIDFDAGSASFCFRHNGIAGSLRVHLQQQQVCKLVRLKASIPGVDEMWDYPAGGYPPVDEQVSVSHQASEALAAAREMRKQDSAVVVRRDTGMLINGDAFDRIDHYGNKVYLECKPGAGSKKVILDDEDQAEALVDQLEQGKKIWIEQSSGAGIYAQYRYNPCGKLGSV